MEGLNNLLRHAVDSLRDPRGQARWVMSFQATRVQRWSALLAVSLASTVLSVLLQVLRSGDLVFPLGMIEVTPLAGAVATFANGVITVFIVYWAGRAFGGEGGFGNTISVVTWLQFILGCFVALQVLLAVLVPSLLNPSDVFALVALMFLLGHFVAELHGFRSALNVLFVTVAFFVGLVLGLSAIASMLLDPATTGAIF